MARIGSLALAFMLFASLGFAWVVSPPSCETQYSLEDANFTLTTKGETMCGYANSSASYNLGEPTATLSTVSGGINFTNTATTETWEYTGVIYPPQTAYNISGRISNYNGMTGGASIGIIDVIINGSLQVRCGQNQRSTAGTNGTNCKIEYSPTSINITNNIGATSVYSVGYINILLNSSLTGTGVEATTEVNVPYHLSNKELSKANVSVGMPTLSGLYILTIGSTVLRSDFTSGFSSEPSNTNYCRSLLYFNNPYYGNIQLTPKITYIPGVSAFPDWYNVTGGAAYIPNNTITYVYDSTTSAWYIVPATICSSYSVIGSTSTIQYNPTGIGGVGGGSVPIDVYLSGSCSYTTATRVISCTGSDASGTVTSLNLTAYPSGNTTAVCNEGTAGSSGTLTCTLPNVNGTYNAYFYGTDANLFTHTFASKSVRVGGAYNFYGKDAYLAVLLVVVVAATIMTSSIAVSMILGCFGLFVALAFGVLPISDAPVVVIMTAVALALVYRLKV